MRIEEGIKLDFDDVLIRPKRSNAPSRKSVELIRTFKLLHGQIFTCLPIIASNMDVTGCYGIAKELWQLKACCTLHKFYSFENLKKIFSSSYTDYLFYTLGLKDEEFWNLNKLADELGSPFQEFVLTLQMGIQNILYKESKKFENIFQIVF